ncbi:class II aldolase/adducin family protein [uncultured Pseudoteredinibacter sp.]|uniref:class II aldolase/adducin family protein n=1 Tax=uncultured Pseudoteredinibacter sp. TaxID=1641701 RepID=UPI0026141C31|nr:class II aldolase/adducin family protein [uncultured Pseudoteredinibacter sp.]
MGVGSLAFIRSPIAYSDTSLIDGLKSELIIANKILSNQGVFDAFGHISFRVPSGPGAFIMSYSKSPELVTLDDLAVYDKLGEPLHQSERVSFRERYIHSELYQSRPDVMAVCHHHSDAIIPYTVTNTPMRPVVLVAATIGSKIPTWDPKDYLPFVNSAEKGRDFAKSMGDATVALLRGHGCTVVGAGIREVVMTSIYLQRNALMLSQSLALGKVKSLSETEISKLRKILFAPDSRDRAWEYWKHKLDVM